MLRLEFFMLFLTLRSRSIRSFTLPLQAARSCLSQKKSRRRFMSTSASAAAAAASNNDKDDSLADHLPLEVPIATAIQLHGQVAFLDGSWWLGQPDKARQAYKAGPRIAGGAFYDIDVVASTTADLNPKNLPHMMPPPDLQAAFMDACGITNHQHVIIYGQEQCPFVHRAWYQVMAMGHGVEKTHLLAGSLQDWINAGGPVDTKPTKAWRVDDENNSNNDKPRTYQAVHPAVVSMEELQQLIRDAPESIQIVDARSAERFQAQVDEPRPGLRRGHMPGAQNLFFQDVLQADSLVQLRDVESLTRLTQGLKKDSQQRIIATCGSGATGCTILAALVKAGFNPDQLALYDGSWMEWGRPDSNTPVVDEREVKKRKRE